MGLMMVDEDMVKEGIDAARVGIGMQESSMISVCEAARAVADEAIVQTGDVISSCSSLPITPERMTVHYERDDAIYYKLLSHTVPGYGLAFERKLSYLQDGIIIKVQLNLIKFKELAILLEKSILGLLEDSHQCILIKSVQ